MRMALRPQLPGINVQQAALKGKGPDDRNQRDCDHRADRVEREAHAHEVGEAVAAWSVDDQMRLVGDGRSECATTRNRNRHDESARLKSAEM